MRIAVIGAGGVGGYFGGRLAQAGHDVTFVARGRHLAALRERGLVIESGTGNAHVTQATFTDDVAAVAPCDVVMFCVKLWDVETAARQIAPLVARGGVVIPFQNGVDAPDVLTRTLGAAKVLGGIAYIAATIREPGVIAHTGSMARLVVGPFEGGNAEAAHAFRERLRRRERSMRPVAPTSAARCGRSSACCRRCPAARRSSRQPVGVVRAVPELRAAFEAAAREAMDASDGRRAWRSPTTTWPAARVPRRPSRGDALVDAERPGAGNRLEAPWLSGAVARMSAEAGVRRAGERDPVRRGHAVCRRRAARVNQARTSVRLILTWLINAMALIALPYVFSSIKRRLVPDRAARRGRARSREHAHPPHPRSCSRCRSRS